MQQQLFSLKKQMQLRLRSAEMLVDPREGSMTHPNPCFPFLQLSVPVAIQPAANGAETHWSSLRQYDLGSCRRLPRWQPGCELTKSPSLPSRILSPHAPDAELEMTSARLPVDEVNAIEILHDCKASKKISKGRKLLEGFYC